MNQNDVTCPVCKLSDKTQKLDAMFMKQDNALFERTTNRLKENRRRWKHPIIFIAAFLFFCSGAFIATPVSNAAASIGVSENTLILITLPLLAIYLFLVNIIGYQLIVNKPLYNVIENMNFYYCIRDDIVINLETGKNSKPEDISVLLKTAAKVAAPIKNSGPTKLKKHIARFCLSGIILFIFIVGIVDIFYVTGLMILPSIRYSHDISLVAISISIYTGLAFFIGLSQFIVEDDTVRKHDKNKKLSLRIPIFLVLSLLVGLFTKWAFVTSSATLLHQYSPKENITLEVIAKREYQRGWGYCAYFLVIETPRISSNYQRICISHEQRMFFENQSMPMTMTMTVILTGQESYFGYDLKCCK